MCSIKTPQTGPSSLVLATFSWVWPLSFKVNMERSSCRECAEVLIQLHSMQCMMQPWCNPDQTLYTLKKTNITMLHYVTQEQTHPHIDSYDVPRLLRHFVVLSQKHSDFGAWDAQGKWKVFLCNSAASEASEASARSLSLQATRCCRYCRYIDSSARFDH